ncbi:hypothetical protein PYW08_005597 [Mythimna loreyi]|uniref:Uncharacterized protein n=1 Tax=Mythimna loreyi TaxID=667449 RepID=A0ACC2QH14_9NEOP|nr:hypothetical protein PYW08_005597 [Mythimna loreyi]
MIKILVIFVFVLVCYCEINAEIASRHGKATTKQARRTMAKKNTNTKYIKAPLRSKGAHRQGEEHGEGGDHKVLGHGEKEKSHGGNPHGGNPHGENPHGGNDHGENLHGENDQEVNDQGENDLGENDQAVGGHAEGDHAEGDHTEGAPTEKIHKKYEKDYPLYISPYALYPQMVELMKEFPNANATVTKFARTVEYNDIVLISVSEKKTAERYSRAKDSKYVEDAPEKKIIFIVHGLTVMGMKSLMTMIQLSELRELFSYYFKYLDKFDFFIMPLANPDGYSASRSADHAIWNKNMSPQSVCPGVFVDRNFDIAWNVTRDISSCSQLYPGATPFSEVESKAVRDVFHYYSHKILAYIHLHAGTFDERVFKGDAILYPRGYTESQSDDDKYIDLKGEIDEAMKNASFRVISVTVDTLASWYGVVSGSSVDYAASVFGIPYALEFVMQIYDNDALEDYALTQIWARLIDTTFNNMWKSLHHASEERKSH